MWHGYSPFRRVFHTPADSYESSTHWRCSTHVIVLRVSSSRCSESMVSKTRADHSPWRESREYSPWVHVFSMGVWGGHFSLRGTVRYFHHRPCSLWWFLKIQAACLKAVAPPVHFNLMFRRLSTRFSIYKKFSVFYKWLLVLPSCIIMHRRPKLV